MLSTLRGAKPPLAVTEDETSLEGNVSVWILSHDTMTWKQIVSSRSIDSTKRPL